jgi:hypothetical protein
VIRSKEMTVSREALTRMRNALLKSLLFTHLIYISQDIEKARHMQMLSHRTHGQDT